MKFGQRDFGASEAWFSGIQNETVAGGGGRIALAGVPAVLGQTVKVNSNAKAQFRNTRHARGRPRQTREPPGGILTVGVKKKA